MKKKTILAISALIGIIFSTTALASNYTGKKVLYIDSYHAGYAWSDGITTGIERTLKDTGADLKIVRMDTKRNADDDFKKEAAAKAKAVIEEYQPDVVIASDDNAAKFLIMPFYKNADTPFVFCGVNWDAATYGFPYKNVTGMVEVTPIPQLIEQLSQLAKGDRVGFLGPDILTAQKEVQNYQKVFGLNPTAYFAKNFEDWKKGFTELQGKVDMLIIDSDGGLYKEHEAEMRAFAESNTKIPTGAAYDFMAPFSILTYGKVAQEQGDWAADAALKILAGTSPSDIPVAKNKEGVLVVNAKIAVAAGTEVPFEILSSADKVIE